MDRRSFIATAAGAGVALKPGAAELIREAVRPIAHLSPQQAAQDEAFWLRVRQAYTIDANHVNLNSGSVSPAPRVVSEAMNRYWTMTNMSPSLYVDDLLYPEVELVRRRLERRIALQGAQQGEQPRVDLAAAGFRTFALDLRGHGASRRAPPGAPDWSFDAYVEEDRSLDELVAIGFDPTIAKRVILMIDRNEYKRRQAPIGIKITHRAFGKDRRMPITNGYR
mgnify:CR=1 FL=1